MAEDPAIKMLIDPGDYPCVIEVPQADGSTVELSGEIELGDGSRAPRGSLFGDVPLKVEDGMSAFPQRYDYPLLHGKLRNNYDLRVIDATVTTWFGGQAHFTASAVLVGLMEDRSAESIAKCRFQVERLDRLIDFAPIVASKTPKPETGKPLEWWAKERDSRYHEWTDPDGQIMNVGFDARARTADPYRLAVRYLPIGTITFAEPVKFSELIDSWLEPLTDLLTVVAGKATHLTYVEVTIGGQKAQLFGSQILQAPFISEPWSGNDLKPAIHIGPESENLLKLVSAWRGQVDDRAPLFETYSSMAWVTDDHPRHRFLLLLQALEGHYGYVHAEEIEVKRQAFVADRASRVEVVEASGLDDDTVKFVKKHLRRRFDPQLRDALNWAMSLVPQVASDRLASAELLIETVGREECDGTWVDALRVVRNDLAHGTRGYEPHQLGAIASLFEIVVRAHVLLALGVDADAIDGMFAGLAK